jgi:hypothetical protein
MVLAPVRLLSWNAQLSPLSRLKRAVIAPGIGNTALDPGGLKFLLVFPENECLFFEGHFMQWLAVRRALSTTFWSG